MQCVNYAFLSLHILFPQDAAKEYYGQMLAVPGEVLPRNADGLPVFDLVLLGLGPDGHICSLFPNRSQTAAKEGWSGSSPLSSHVVPQIPAHCMPTSAAAPPTGRRPPPSRAGAAVRLLQHFTHYNYRSRNKIKTHADAASAAGFPNGRRKPPKENRSHMETKRRSQLRAAPPFVCSLPRLP